MTHEYANFRTLQYEGGAVFIPVCPKCGRFIKADVTIYVDGLENLVRQPNATCSKCGRVEMPFMGFFEEDGER